MEILWEEEGFQFGFKRWPASVQAHIGVWKCPQVSKPWADSGCQLWVYGTRVIDFLPHHLSVLSVSVSWGLSSCDGWRDQRHAPASLLASCLCAGHSFLIELTFDICLWLAGEGTWQPTWSPPPTPSTPTLFLLVIAPLRISAFFCLLFFIFFMCLWSDGDKLGDLLKGSELSHCARVGSEVFKKGKGKKMEERKF